MVNVYVGLAVNGFFTGFGAISAAFIFDTWVKPKIKRLHKRIKGR